jgi:uncharacterized alkaline shock family protein YloU
MTEENIGAVTIAPEVLMDIVRLTALATPGVAALSPDHPHPMSRMFSGKITRGIRLELADNAVSIDLHIIVEPETQLLPLGHTLQHDISRAIQEVVGMPVRAINIHIEDVADGDGIGSE